MATYASATNPFVEKPYRPAIESSKADRLSKKNAPGKARPHSIVVYEGSLSQTDENLVHLNEDCEQIVAYGACAEGAEESSVKLDRGSNNCFNTANVNSEASRVLEVEDVEDEVAKTCESLIDAACRTATGDSEVSSTTTSTGKTNSSVVLPRQKRVNNHVEDENDGDDDLGDDYSSDSCLADQDSRRYQHIELIKKLRLQLRDLERYAYERGELEQVPDSVLSTRQTVIIDTLKEKLSLTIDKNSIEKLDFDELKRQLDKEVRELIDPLITKEYLLNQLKTQLTDLERYISQLQETLNSQKRSGPEEGCRCHFHGCSALTRSQTSTAINQDGLQQPTPNGFLSNSEILPKTSRLIRTLMAQLICSDIKVQRNIRKEHELINRPVLGNSQVSCREEAATNIGAVRQSTPASVKLPAAAAPQFHDGAIWTIHIDKVILATDSLVNLYTLEPKYQRANEKTVDENLVESVVRRQLVPAIRELLSYGLIDPTPFPRSTSYMSALFDPYFLFSSLTCLPGAAQANRTSDKSTTSLPERVHIWNIIEDYYESRNQPNFQKSSVKTLSQSFNLTPSLDGPIRVTSKQALLIAVDDLIEKLSRCKSNGPEAHFKLFVCVALNQRKLTTWLRLVFKSKSLLRKYYHNFSFVSQAEKVDKFLATIDELSQIEFKLRTDSESIDHFVSAF